MGGGLSPNPRLRGAAAFCFKRKIFFGRRFNLCAI
jgi:hypothetical protein